MALAAALLETVGIVLVVCAAVLMFGWSAGIGVAGLFCWWYGMMAGR